ncbi:hypothetical protein, partial [Jeotgalibaca porci]|uniref:hypothetical protein n=1 Tax=Jeotgalibaca porci TaxID=1868793 RepID=UPI00359FAAB3
MNPLKLVWDSSSFLICQAGTAHSNAKLNLSAHFQAQPAHSNVKLDLSAHFQPQPAHSNTKLNLSAHQPAYS